MKDMQKMMKQVQKMQADVAKVQEELQNEMVEVETGGVVKVVFNGHGDIQSIQIAPEAIDPNDPEMLQDLILTAVREGQKKAQEMASDRLGQVTGNLNLPPGMM